MNYAAVNAKLKAMSAKILPRDSEAIPRTAVNICRYILGKAQRDYVNAMARAAHSTFEGGLSHYVSQWKRLNRLDKPNKLALRGVLGAEIDLNNILWMYRLKRYHNVAGDATYGYLVPIRYKLSREVTRRMAEVETAMELLEEVARGPYGEDFAYISAYTVGKEAAPGALAHSGDIGERGPTPDYMLAIALNRRYITAARRHPDTLAPVLAFLHKQKLAAQKQAGPFTTPDVIV